MDFFYRIGFVKYVWFNALYSDIDHIESIKDIENDILRTYPEKYDFNLYKIACHMSYMQDTKILSDFLSRDSFTKDHAMEIFEISLQSGYNKVAIESMILNSFDSDDSYTQHEIFKIAADKHLPNIAAFMIKMGRADVLLDDMHEFKSDSYAMKVINLAIKDKIVEEKIHLELLEKQMQYADSFEEVELAKISKHTQERIDFYNECFKMSEAYIEGKDYSIPMPVIILPEEGPTTDEVGGCDAANDNEAGGGNGGGTVTIMPYPYYPEPQQFVPEEVVPSIVLEENYDHNNDYII